MGQCGHATGAAPVDARLTGILLTIDLNERVRLKRRE